MKDYTPYSPCRVCGLAVTPWRRDWRRPTITIHEECLTQNCRHCGGLFQVGKERRGLFCSNPCQHAWRASKAAA